MEEYITNAFTRTGNQTNLEVNNLNVTCITSTNNKFSLDSEGNLTVKSITTETEDSVSVDMNTIYPVGSIYMTVNNINPSTLFGGTWEQIKDKFLLASGDTYANSTTGGNSSTTYTPEGTNTGTAITSAQMPPHSHTQHNYTLMNDSGAYDLVLASGNACHAAAGRATYYTGSTGSGQAHSHSFNGTPKTISTMPPYIAVNVWKRTQ